MARGQHLSSMDLLPEEATVDIAWACEQLHMTARTLEDIRFEMNDRLAVKGIDPISKSAFQRKSARIEADRREARESREMFRAIGEEYSAKEIDDSNVVLGEFLKSVIMRALSASTGAKSTKQIVELARAYHSTVSAMKISTDRRQKINAEDRKKVDDEAKARLGEAVDSVQQEMENTGRATPDGMAVLKKIREEVYGIFEPAAEK